MSWSHGESVTVHRAGEPTQDADGNDVIPFTDETYAGVAIYPRESVELTTNQTTNVIGLTVVFKPGVTLGALDEMTARGERYELDGEPAQYHHPMTNTSLTRATLRRATG